MEFEYGDWPEDDLKRIKGLLSTPSEKVTFPFDVGKGVTQKEDPVNDRSVNSVYEDGFNGGSDNVIPMVPLSGDGHQIPLVQQAPTGVVVSMAHVENQMMQPPPQQHAMPGFMVDPQTSSVGLSQTLSPLMHPNMMVGHPSSPHMLRASALNAAAPEFVPGSRFTLPPNLMSAGLPQHAPNQPPHLRQPEPMHSMAAHAQLSPVAVQMTGGSPIDQSQMYQGVNLSYSTANNYPHNPAMLQNRNQMRPVIPSEQQQFVPMISAVTEMQAFPGMQQNPNLVSKPRGSGPHVMTSSYGPQGNLHHPVAADPAVNMIGMPGHPVNGPNHDQQQVMAHNVMHGGRHPSHRNNRGVQNGPNYINTSQPRYKLLTRQSEEQRPDVPQHAEINSTHKPSALPTPSFDKDHPVSASTQSKPEPMVTPTNTTTQPAGTNIVPAVDDSELSGGGGGFTFSGEGTSFGFVIDGLEFGKRNNEAVQLPSSKLKGHTKNRSKGPKSTENHAKPAPVPQITSSVQSKTDSKTDTSTKKPTPHKEPVITNGVSSTPSSAAPSEVASPPAQQATTPLSSPPQAAPAPKLWANLFSGAPNTSLGQGGEAGGVTPPSSRPVEMPSQPIRPADDTGAIISRFQLKSSAVSLQARRLINQVNWCYVNATLQALLACPPFYHALKALPSYPPLSLNQKSSTPVLEAMVEFVNEFSEMKYEKQHSDKPGKHRKKDLKLGDPFEPSGVYNVLPVMKTSENMFARGKQEDAEEFLACLLNKLHEEMGEAVKQHQKKLSADGLPNGNGDVHASDSEHSQEESDDDGAAWEQVGPKNKSVVTHSNADKYTTPISEIFGGLLRSSLSTGSSSKESTVLEPFFTVPLNVQTNSTVEEALRAFVSKEVIEGYTCQQTKQETDAHRRLTFERLPPVLILHLKCFVYDKHGGSQKVLHTMDFSTVLEFEKDLFSPQARNKYLPKEKRSYKLFAVEYHSGTKTTGGHYHTDLFHLGVRNWVRFDDNSVAPIEERHVLDVKHPCVPYLLYYKRMDTITASNTTSGAGNSNKSGAHNSVLIK